MTELTESQEDLKASFLEQLDVSGERFTSGSRTVRGVVARGQVSELDHSAPQLAGRSLAGHLAEDVTLKSTLEFLRDDFAVAPKQGDDFLDTDNVHHRVKYMFTSDLTYKLRCHMSPDP